jgi:hypothetical protein
VLVRSEVEGRVALVDARWKGTATDTGSVFFADNRRKSSYSDFGGFDSHEGSLIRREILS